MVLAAERLIDWKAARTVGGRIAGEGPALSALERARLREDFAEVVSQAEELVERFTGLSPGPNRSRAWVMTRSEWVAANLRGFEQIVEPFARKLVGERRDSRLSGVRRVALGAHVGGLPG